MRINKAAETTKFLDLHINNINLGTYTEHLNPKINSGRITIRAVTSVMEIILNYFTLFISTPLCQSTIFGVPTGAKIQQPWWVTE
jgi:hypothetical protein